MSQNFNIEPYYDDFEAANGALENNYMRILFRPGYAVQARELTQIQSILQNQIKQFGNHIFQDGSPVIGGHLSVDTGATYVKLEKQFGGADIDVDDFLNLTVFNNATPRTRARVIQTYTGTDDRALLVRYIRGSEFNASETITTTTNQSATTLPVNFTGLGSVCTINDGVFYAEGYFVKVPQQTIVLDPYSTTPTYRVGLQIVEEVVTENEDTALLDTAQNSFNYQAPGAHRYKFNLVLTKRSITSVDDGRFYELLRIENGVVTKRVSYPVYSELEKTLARRTYDESGDYVVKPFRVNLSANTPAGLSENTSTFIINIEPGKAYVKGFEFETIGTQKISNDRAKTFKDSLNYNLSVYYGNRIQLTNYRGGSDGIGFSKDIESVDIHCIPENLVSLGGSSHNYYVSKIGSAKIKNIDRGGGVNDYYVYLMDLEFTPILGTVKQDSLYLNEIYLPAHFAAVEGAYKDATITLLTGAAAGESAIITGYNSQSKLAQLNREFRSAPQEGDQFSISMPFTSAESFVKADSLFTTTLIKANVAKSSKDAVDSAVLEDTSFNKNIFELPNYYVRYDSDQNVSLYRRLIRRVQFTANGSHTFGLTTAVEGVFDFGTDGQVVSNAEVNENIMVMPVEGSNAYNIIDMTATGRAVRRVNQTQIEINTGNASGGTFYADVLLTTKLEGIENTKRAKTLISSNAEITQYDVPSAATSIINKSDVKLNLANGVVWFTTSDVINKQPGVPQSLFISDVVKINKIYDSGSLIYSPNTTDKIDVTDNYVFNSGQTDQYYDHASITLKPGAPPPKGQLAVFFNYYDHTGYGYLAASSYTQNAYDNEQIPIYKSSTGAIYNLRDCIDMRPIRNVGTKTAPYTNVTLSPTVNIAAGKTVITANLNRVGANVLAPPLLSGSVVRINSEERIISNVYSAQFKNTSTSSISVGIGPQSFTLPIGTELYTSQVIRLANTSNTFMLGDVTAYNVSSGAATVNVTIAVGSGTYAGWDVSAVESLTVTEPFTTTATNTSIQLVQPNKKFGNADVYVQRPTDPFELDFSYYLPRTDLLVLTKDKEFKVLQGVPSVAPVEPVVNEDAMPIYRLSIPAYTASLNSVNLEYIDNRRYTMKDISQIDERLNDLEELIKLKEAEADIINNPPKSPTAPTINKPIYSTLVDDFEDFNVADTNKDFQSSIEDSKLTCYKNVVNLKLAKAAQSDSAPTFDKFESINYTEVSAVSQKFATSNSEQQVQTAIIGKFEGFVSLTPESDYYFSTEHQPLITDVLGRFVELQIRPKPLREGFNEAFIQKIGGANYRDLYYYDSVVLGNFNPITNLFSITAPAYSNDPTQFEPKTTVQTTKQFDGTAFNQYQGTNWTGVTSTMNGGIYNNAASPGWTQASELAARSGLFVADGIRDINK